MKVECPRTSSHRDGSRPRWIATGEFNTNGRGLRRAVLRCLVPGCGYYWSSGLPEAIAAGERLAADPETAPSEPCPVPVPQPTLPMSTTRGGDFVTPKQLAQSVHYNHVMDAKRRASGDSE